MLHDSLRSIDIPLHPHRGHTEMEEGRDQKSKGNNK